MLWFGALGLLGLFSPDEGRYALIPKEMLARGDWVTPHLNGLVYLEKPPLQYWATAVAFKALGEEAFAARLWPALCGLGAALLAGWFAWRRGGPVAGLAALAMLGSSLLFFLFSQVATLDMGLAFFLTLALVGLMQAEAGRVRADGSHRLRWLLAAWVALALAFLSKGLVAFVLPGLALALYMVLRRDWRLPLRLHLLRGLAIVLLLCAPWMMAAQWAHGEFFDFFIVHEHFARFGSDVHRRTGAWWYFIAIVLVGMLPWSAFWSWSSRGARSGPAVGGPAFSDLAGRDGRVLASDCSPVFDERLFMRIWIAVVVIFFSLSRSKLPGYVLPVFPFIAIQIGLFVAAAPPVQLARRCWSGVLVAAILVVVALVMASTGIDDVPPALAQDFLPWALTAAFLLASASLAARPLFRRGRVSAALLVLGFCSLVGWQTLLSGATVFEASYSARAFAAEVNRSLAAGERSGTWYSVGTFDNSFGFYMGRELVLVAYRDELDLGLAIDPERGIDTLEEFVERWVADEEAGAMMQPRTYDALSARGLPMAVVARDARRVFVLRQRLQTSLL